MTRIRTATIDGGRVTVIAGLPEGAEIKHMCDVPEGWEVQSVCGCWTYPLARKDDWTGLVVCRPPEPTQPEDDQ